MFNVSRVWQNKIFARTVGASYDWAFEQEGLASRYGRLVMGADLRRAYGMMTIVGEMPDGSTILDVPCGGGITLRRLHVDQRVRYVALDISPTMLARARTRTPTRLLQQVEFVEGNVERMPFSEGEFDLCVCFNGLHCLPDPAAAVREIARCLRRGGRLVGNLATRGQVRRADLYMALLRGTGTFGPAGTPDDVRQWFTDAGLQIDTLECSGAIAYFSVHRAETEAALP